MGDSDFDRRLAQEATRIFAEEWVLALSPVLSSLTVGSRARHNERRHFWTSFAHLQARHAGHITFLPTIKAIGDRISLTDGSFHEPLCELFTYFMQMYRHPHELNGFDLRRWVNRRSAG